MMLRWLRWVPRAWLLLGLLVPSVARAQEKPAPARPRLPAAADTNNWEAYFDRGVERIRRDPEAAAAAFHWASRLAPHRAEPLYAQWVVYWMVHWQTWPDYLEGRRKVLTRPEVVRTDSLRRLAYLRNPFVHKGLTALIYDQTPGHWEKDAWTKGLLAYAAADLPTAAENFAKVIARDSVKNLWVRWLRASALVTMRQFDGALAEMTALLRQLRQADDTALVQVYESKEMVLYGIGLLHTVRGRPGQAQEAFREALVENLAFAPAHRALAHLATARRDAASAIAELAQAVELDGADPVLRYDYGAALLAGGRVPEAVEQLRFAVQREPWWAEPHFTMGRALKEAGAKDQAAEAFGLYLSRAPRNAVVLGTARAELAALKRPN